MLLDSFRLDDEQGRLGESALPPGRIPLPVAVRLEEAAGLQNLVWEVPIVNGRLMHGSALPSDKMLEDLAKLSDKRPAAYIAFAQAWGTLSIHELRQQAIRGAGQTVVAIESLSDWAVFSRMVGGMLEVAQHLRERQVPPGPLLGVALGRRTYSEAETEAELPEWERFDPYRLGVGNTLEGCQALVANALDVWLRVDAGNLQLTWDGATTVPRVVLQCNGLLGAVAVQLMYAIAGSKQSAHCNGCGHTFFTNRAPSPGFRAYCEECRTKAAQRDAQRDSRLRKKLGTEAVPYKRPRKGNVSGS